MTSRREFFQLATRTAIAAMLASNHGAAAEQNMQIEPSGAVAFNVHDGTKLYASTLLTLQAVFPSVHLYPSGQGEVATVVTAEPAPDTQALAARAKSLQDRLGFRFALPTLLARRNDRPNTTQTGELLTDDFAPVNVYDTMGERRRKK